MPSLPDKHNHQIPTVGLTSPGCAGTIAVRGNAPPQGTQWSTRHRISSFSFTKENKPKKILNVYCYFQALWKALLK